MPIFLICIIVFVIWFRVKTKKNDKAINSQNDAFWEREEQANFARKKDISELEYLSIPDSAFPIIENANEEEKALTDQVLDCAHRKMINLSAYSNTELKEQYGIAHLEELSNCDQNFMYFIRALSQWGNYLYNQKEYTRAQEVMELSLSIGSDISVVYTTLANIYGRNKQYDKIDALIERVDHSSMSLKESLIKKLKLIKLES